MLLYTPTSQAKSIPTTHKDTPISFTNSRTFLPKCLDRIYSTYDIRNSYGKKKMDSKENEINYKQEIQYLHYLTQRPASKSGDN
jgi:hypothetical protein